MNAQSPKNLGPRHEIIVKAPRCPKCASTRLLAYRTACRDGYGTTRYTRCADCGTKILLIIE
jgi:DNA-directed RNA polymerase subunit RPC12/RpoP